MFDCGNSGMSVTVVLIKNDDDDDDDDDICIR